MLAVQPLSVDSCVALAQRALQAKAKGDDRGYIYLLTQIQMVSPAIQVDPTSNPWLSLHPIWLQALNRSVSLIKPHYSELSSIIFSFDWTADAEAVGSYVELLLNLISSDGSHATPCLQMLVRNFFPRRDIIGSEVDVQETSEKISKHIHHALRSILDLVPSSSMLLFDVLSKSFPHKKHDTETHRLYLFNLLQIVAYCEALKASIISLAVRNLLQVDVEIRLESFVDEDEDDEVQFTFEMGENEAPNEMATKLDVMMNLMFTFVDSFCNKGEKEKKETFALLLQIFDTFILKTHKSKYTQFLLFYICQMDPSFSEAFVVYLLNKMLDCSNHSLTRCTCAAYIASFLARAKLVPASLCIETVKVMATWCNKYLESHAQSLPDAEAHALFYSIAQAIFYVVCFKYKILLQTEEARRNFRQLYLDKIIWSRLNPFKFCLPTVVQEFMRINEVFALLSCAEIVEKNKKLVLPTKSLFGGDNQLDTFFPFDPYLLRQSSKHINDLYQTWAPIDEVNRGHEQQDLLPSASSPLPERAFRRPLSPLPHGSLGESPSSLVSVTPSSSWRPTSMNEEAEDLTATQLSLTPEASNDVDLKFSWEASSSSWQTVVNS